MAAHAGLFSRVHPVPDDQPLRRRVRFFVNQVFLFKNRLSGRKEVTPYAQPISLCQPDLSMSDRTEVAVKTTNAGWRETCHSAHSMTRLSFRVCGRLAALR